MVKELFQLRNLLGKERPNFCGRQHPPSRINTTSSWKALQSHQSLTGVSTFTGSFPAANSWSTFLLLMKSGRGITGITSWDGTLSRESSTSELPINGYLFG